MTSAVKPDGKVTEVKVGNATYYIRDEVEELASRINAALDREDDRVKMSRWCARAAHLDTIRRINFLMFLAMFLVGVLHLCR